MSLSLTDVVTAEQIATAATEELVTIYNWVRYEITNRGRADLIEQTAATQAAIAAVDTAVDVNEDLKFPKGDG